MRRLSGVLLGGLLLTVTAGSAFAQAEAWQRKWYWGAQTGAYIYSTASSATRTAVTAGGHWFITARRSALIMSVDQIFFGTTNAALTDGSTVRFNSGRRIQGSLVAVPSNANLQPYVGVGFAIHNITDATATGSFATPDDQAAAQRRLSDVDTKAFVVFTGGFQWRMGTRWAFYGNYQYMPSSGSFLITSEQHAITAGLRVALSSSHEEVTTER
ncbi:MAG TPA: hypothetical protein VGA37_01295 [Gemmatimonadales bacterium]